MQDTQRLDKWLWMARFYKSRKLAIEAIKAGHIRVNGERCKPSKAIRCGDVLAVTRGGYRWSGEVIALAERRGPASEAHTLYRESQASIEQRAAMVEERKLVTPSPGKRPDKRQRAKIIRFINKKDI